MINQLALLLLQAPEVPQSLSTNALIFMLTSMAAVTALAGWCFFRILSGKEHFDPDGTGPAKPPVAGEVEREGRQPDP